MSAAALRGIAPAASRARARPLPLRGATLFLFATILCVDNPFESPFAKLWESPLSPLGSLLYENLHNFTGVSVLRFSLLSVLIPGLIVLAVLRRGPAARGVPRMPGALQRALAVMFAAILALELWGLLRGGDFRQSLWQVQCLMFFPLIAVLFDLTLRGPADHRGLGKVVLFSACFKTFLGAYFLYFVARPQGLQPPYVTQHTDTLLFVGAITIAVALWMEQPSARNTLLCAVVLPIVSYGIAINDRRLAYVSAGACLVAIVLLSPWNRSKRFLVRGLVLMLPLLIVYGFVGWSSTSGRLFKPVRVLRTVVAPEDTQENLADSSTNFRTLENFNLVKTWMANPVLGAGFGHPYDEVLKLPDISKYFPAYRYVPHNGILWLWGVGGFVGVSALWMFLAVTVLVTVRAYRASRLPENRAAALASICMVIAFLNQAFGDMGTQSWESMFLLAAAVVTGGKLAVATGAWSTPRARPSQRQPPAAAPVPLERAA